MLAFQHFDRHAAGASDKPFVTIQRNGTLITLNKAAYRLSNNPQSVELSYDPNEKLIGIRAIDASVPRSYPVRPMTKSGSTYTIAGRAFTLHFDIDTSVAMRYSTYKFAEYLVVDLKQPGTDVTGPRIGGSKK